MRLRPKVVGVLRIAGRDGPAAFVFFVPSCLRVFVVKFLVASLFQLGVDQSFTGVPSISKD